MTESNAFTKCLYCNNPDPDKYPHIIYSSRLQVYFTHASHIRGTLSFLSIYLYDMQQRAGVEPTATVESVQPQHSGETLHQLNHQTTTSALILIHVAACPALCVNVTLSANLDSKSIF